MTIQRTLHFFAFLIAIQAAGLLADSAPLYPEYVTQSDSKIIVTDAEPFPLGLVQLVGHKFQQSGERYLSGLDLGLNRSTSKYINFAISLLGDNLALGYEVRNEGNSSAAISSLADSKKVSIIEISPKVWDMQNSEKSIEFETFVPSRAIFFEKAIAFHGRDGMESIVRVMDRDLSPDAAVIITARQLVRDDLQVAGLDRIYKIDEESMLVAASLHSTEEDVFKQKNALLMLNLKGTLQNAYHFVATSYDVYANERFIALAAITGNIGSFLLELTILDKGLQVSKSTSISINKFFPAQFKFVDGGERPLLAVLGLESVEVFDGESGEKLLTFKTKHEITDIIRFLIVDGKIFLFVNLRSEAGGAPRGAYFELPSTNIF